MTTLFDLAAVPVGTKTPEQVSYGSTGRASRYAVRLAAVLGDGREWEYRGECWELPRATGNCACGHMGLIFQFRIHHTKSSRTAIVGSSCINSYSGITPELVAGLQLDLERLQNEARLRIAKAKDAARSEKVQSLLRELSALEWEIERACLSWEERNYRTNWKPEPIYRRGNYRDRLSRKEARDAAGELHPFTKIPGLKTTAGQIKRLESAIAEAKRDAADIWKC